MEHAIIVQQDLTLSKVDLDASYVLLVLTQQPLRKQNALLVQLLLLSLYLAQKLPLSVKQFVKKSVLV